jgi:hypothetical protein
MVPGSEGSELLTTQFSVEVAKPDLHEFVMLAAQRLLSVQVY